MPQVHLRPDLVSPSSLLASWLSAVAAVPSVLLISAIGQGLGTLVAGGGWIGICTPWDRQVWALVNQPVLNFSALPAATGYWLGSWAAPFLTAVLIMPLSLRLKSASSQLAVLQTGWIALVIGASWQTFLDPVSGHLARWLGFRELPAAAAWVVVAAAIAAVPPFVIRLLAIARITRFHLSRSRRVGLVVIHLIPIPAACVAAFIILEEAVPVEACVAAGFPVLAALIIAWFGYPAPLTHPVTAVGARGLATLVVAVVLGFTAVAAAGRPLAGDRVSAVQWAREGSTNNIREWMVPWRAPWLPEADGAAPRVPGGMTDNEP